MIQILMVTSKKMALTVDHTTLYHCFKRTPYLRGGGCGWRVDIDDGCGGVPLVLPEPVRSVSTVAVSGCHRL
jgi:hypothetical protein